MPVNRWLILMAVVALVLTQVPAAVGGPQPLSAVGAAGAAEAQEDAQPSYKHGGHHHDMGGHPHGSTHCPPAGKNCSGLEDPTATGTTGWPAGCKVEQVAPGTVCTDTCATNFNLVTTVAVCQLNGTWQIVDTNALCIIIASCFSAATKVVVRGKEAPMAMRDLCVGQEVLCFNSGPDMHTPGAPAWCEVKNFAHAEDGSFSDAVKITHKAADGSRSTTTVSAMHMMHLLTKTTPETDAATPKALGDFKHELAGKIKPGDILVVATGRDLDATFNTAVVEKVERLTAPGKYIPAIEMPYILADGVVAPLWSTWFKAGDTGSTLALPTDLQSANAVRHMVMAPLWMTNIQPKGTPGHKAQWAGKARPPLTQALSDMWKGQSGTEGRVRELSGAADLTRALEWFGPKYEQWKADASKPILQAEVVEAWPAMFDAGRAAVQVSLTDTSVQQETV